MRRRAGFPWAGFHRSILGVPARRARVLRRGRLAPRLVEEAERDPRAGRGAIRSAPADHGLGDQPEVIEVGTRTEPCAKVLGSRAVSSRRQRARSHANRTDGCGRSRARRGGGAAAQESLCVARAKRGPSPLNHVACLRATARRRPLSGPARMRRHEPLWLRPSRKPRARPPSPTRRRARSCARRSGSRPKRAGAPSTRRVRSPPDGPDGGRGGRASGARDRISGRFQRAHQQRLGLAEPAAVHVPHGQIV